MVTYGTYLSVIRVHQYFVVLGSHIENLRGLIILHREMRHSNGELSFSTIMQTLQLRW
jgi:hypothetical protein